MKPESIERTDAGEKVEQLSISELLANGKRDFLVGDLPNALKSLQRAVALSSAKYGEFAIECGEAYYLFGCALLDRARSENEVLGEAVKGVPLGEKSNDAEAEDGDEKGSGVVTDSEAEGAESAEKTDREQLAEMVIDALCASEKAENAATAEQDATAAPEQTAQTEGEVKTSESTEKASESTETKASETSEAKTGETAEPKASEASEPTEAKAAEDAEAKPTETAEATDVQADSTTKPKSDDAQAEENGEDDDESVDDSSASSDADGDAEGEADGDAEERTTLGVAWEWLDLARIVFDKQSRAFSGAEPSTSASASTNATDAAEQPAAAASSEQAPEQAAAASTSEGELQCVAKHDARRCAARLADCHVRLGEVLMERAEFESAVGEFEAALRIRESQRDSIVASTDDTKDEERVDGEMRALAETYYQLALANQNAERYDDAVRSFERAVETLNARRTQLSARLERSEKDSDGAKKLSADIEDLDGCVTDLRQRIADALDEKRFKALAQQEGAATTGAPFGVASDAGSAAVTASDATHLVKRKRKADGVDADTEGEEKENGKAAVETPVLKDAANVQADGDAQQIDTDGVPAKTRKVEVEQEGAANA